MLRMRITNLPGGAPGGKNMLPIIGAKEPYTRKSYHSINVPKDVAVTIKANPL